MTKLQNTDIVAVSWRDNKIVTLLSTFVSTNPVEKVIRFSKTEKKKVELTCPNIVKVYNKHMGGVDLLDSLLGRYKIKMRTKKWYMRLFYHLLDMTIVNSWLLHKRIIAQKNNNLDLTQKHISLSDFREELGISLCVSGQQITPKRGHPASTLESVIEIRRNKPNAAVQPPKNVRLDQVSHWSTDTNKQSRCKMPGCSSYTWQKCTKCNLPLCVGKGKKCFFKYHTS